MSGGWIGKSGAPGGGVAQSGVFSLDEMNEAKLRKAWLDDSYSKIVLADSPLAYWKLGDTSGTTAVDVIGTSNGTYTGGYTLNQPGIPINIDRSVLLNGTTGYIDCGSPAALNLTSAWTLEIWAYITTTLSQSTLISEVYGADSKVLYALSLGGQGGTSGELQVGFYNGAWRTAQASAISQNIWHHLVGTWDGTILRLYLDGAQVATNTPGSSPSAGMNGVLLGRRWDTSATPYFPGRLAHAAIYGSALSAARILVHYQAAS